MSFFGTLFQCSDGARDKGLARGASAGIVVPSSLSTCEAELFAAASEDYREVARKYIGKYHGAQCTTEGIIVCIDNSL